MEHLGIMLKKQLENKTVYLLFDSLRIDDIAYISDMRDRIFIAIHLLLEKEKGNGKRTSY